MSKKIHTVLIYGYGVMGQGVGCGHRAAGKEQYKKESKASGLPKVLILGFKAGG